MTTAIEQHEFTYTPLEPDPGEHALAKCLGVCKQCRVEFSILRRYRKCLCCGERTVDWEMTHMSFGFIAMCAECRKAIG